MDIKTLTFIYELLKKEVVHTKALLDYSVNRASEIDRQCDGEPDESSRLRLEYAQGLHSKAQDALHVFQSYKWM